MPTQTPAMASPVRSKVRPPDLMNRRKFVRLKHVPVIDVNSRKYRKGDQVVEEHLDEGQLHRICRNSRERESRGEYGLLLLGHTTDGGKEIDQPPVVGYIRNYQVGDHNGRPTILADAYIYRDADPSHVLRQFPRRSAEIIGLEEPDGYVDSLSLIKRAPQRDLGLITHYALDHDASEGTGSVVRFRSRHPVYRFSCPPGRFCSCEEKDEGGVMPKMVGGGRDTKLLKLMKQLVQGILEEVAGEEDLGLEDEGLDGEGMEPEGLEDEGLDEPSSGEDDDDDDFDPSEPSEARFEMEDETSEPSEPSDPSRMHSKRHKSRHSMGNEGSNPGTGPDPASVSQSRKKDAPSRLDPPSRHAADTTTSGYPSPTTKSPDVISVSKSKVPGTKSRHSKEGQVVSRTNPEPIRPKSRMRADSERISRNQSQKEIDRLTSMVEELQKGRLEDQKSARRNAMESRVIQLEAEGFVVDRPTLVRRFMKCTSEKELNSEINYVRKFNKQSPVNQPMLPSGLWTDVGGGSPDRETELTTSQIAEMDTDSQGIEIMGSGVARFAMEDGKIGGRPQDAATAAVSRFRDSRKPSRGRRDPEEN